MLTILTFNPTAMSVNEVICTGKGVSPQRRLQWLVGVNGYRFNLQCVKVIDNLSLRDKSWAVVDKVGMISINFSYSV